MAVNALGTLTPGGAADKIERPRGTPPQRSRSTGGAEVPAAPEK
jgi:hypothetical protein